MSDSGRKALVVCCDGTGQTRDVRKSNISKLTDILSAQSDTDTTSGCRREFNYFPGIGTEVLGIGVDSQVEQLTASSINKHIQIIYFWLCRNYVPDSEIYLFGFSRGAFIVRSLIGMIRQYGLLKFIPRKGDDQLRRSTETTFQDYIKRNVSSEEPLRVRHEDYHWVDFINFVGLFDTVSGLTEEAENAHEYFLNKGNFDGEDNFVLKSVHLMAKNVTGLYPNISYHCKNQDRGVNKCKNIATGDHMEFWVEGDHCDVGGGWYEDEFAASLSNKALKLMIGHCRDSLGITMPNSYLIQNAFASLRVHSIYNKEDMQGNTLKYIGYNFIDRGCSFFKPIQRTCAGDGCSLLLSIQQTYQNDGEGGGDSSSTGKDFSGGGDSGGSYSGSGAPSLGSSGNTSGSSCGGAASGGETDEIAANQFDSIMQQLSNTSTYDDWKAVVESLDVTDFQKMAGDGVIIDWKDVVSSCSYLKYDVSDLSVPFRKLQAYFNVILKIAEGISERQESVGTSVSNKEINVFDNSLLEIENAVTEVLVFKEQCMSLVKSIRGFNGAYIELSDFVSFLNELVKLLVNLRSRSYFSATWMKVNYIDEINMLVQTWNLMSGQKLPQFEDSQKDQVDLLAVVSSNLEEYRPLKLHESRLFTEDMIKNLEILLHSNSYGKIPLREFGNKYLDKASRFSILGHGHFSNAFQGTMRGMKVAAKVLELVADEDNHRNCQLLKNEAQFLQLHSFPGVIQIFGVDNKENPTVMVMELAVCSLSSALHEGTMTLSVEQKLSILSDLCGTISFLHSVGVIHRSISSTNMLIMSGGSAKVSGFELAVSRLSENKSEYDLEGPLMYLAPELLLSEPPYFYTEATDVYSFAILMNEVMSGEKPYENPELLLARMWASLGEDRPKIYAGDFVDIVPLINVCWSLYPADRLPFSLLCGFLRDLVNEKHEFIPDAPRVVVTNIFLASCWRSGYYTGEMMGNMKHGRGVLRCLNGVTYDGVWHKNELNGWSSMLSNDSHFKGEWKNGKREGHGVLMYADGSHYEGEWKDDKREGRGALMYADGSHYEGEWKDDKREGRGVLMYADGSYYEGEWKDDKREGHGADRNV